MMVTLGGLPPDIEVPEIRSLIQQRCSVSSLLLDELVPEAGGTRRVTVGVMSPADGAALRRLAGERLGPYGLYVEPFRPTGKPETVGRPNPGQNNAFDNRRGMNGRSGYNQSNQRGIGMGGSRGGAMGGHGGSLGRGYDGPNYRSEGGLKRQINGGGVGGKRLRGDFDGYNGPNGSHEGAGYGRTGGFNSAARSPPAYDRGGQGKAPPWRQNQVPDSRPSRFESLGNDPWAAKRTHGVRERSRSPVAFTGYGEGRYRREADREPEGPRLGPMFARRPANRSLAIPDRAYSGPSLSPDRSFMVQGDSDRPFRNGQHGRPQMEMQCVAPPFEQLMPTMAPNRTEIFNKPMTVITPAWAIPKLMESVVELGRPAIPFPVNPLHQYGFGIPAQEPSPPFGLQPLLTNRPFQNQRPILKSVKRSMAPMKKKVEESKPLKPHIVQAKVIPTGKTGNMALKLNTVYGQKTASIFYQMVGEKPFDKSDVRTKYKEFANALKQAIGARLRELTNNDPFGKDVLSLYRDAYPLSTDEEMMRGVLAHEAPHLVGPPGTKVLTESVWKGGQRNSLPAEDVVMLDLTSDADTETGPASVPETGPNDMVGSVRADRFRTHAASHIAKLLLQPDAKGKKDMHFQELRLMPVLRDLIDAELQSFSDESVLKAGNIDGLYDMFHAKNTAARNRLLVELAIEKFNAKRGPTYGGVFTEPDKAEKIMEMWPQNRNSAEPQAASKDGTEDEAEQLNETSTPVTSENVTTGDYKKNPAIMSWLRLVSYQLAFETLVGRQLSEDERRALTPVQRQLLGLLRLAVRLRLDKIVEKGEPWPESAEELAARYRKEHPADQNKDLVKVTAEKYKAIMKRNGVVPPINIKMKSVAVTPHALKSWRETCIVPLTSEIVHGRVLTKFERAALPADDRRVCRAVRDVVRRQIDAILPGRRVRGSREMWEMYRAVHGKDGDQLTLETARREMEEEDARKEKERELNREVIAGQVEEDVARPPPPSLTVVDLTEVDFSEDTVVDNLAHGDQKVDESIVIEDSKSEGDADENTEGEVAINDEDLEDY